MIAFAAKQKSVILNRQPTDQPMRSALVSSTFPVLSVPPQKFVPALCSLACSAGFSLRAKTYRISAVGSIKSTNFPDSPRQMAYRRRQLNTKHKGVRQIHMQKGHLHHAKKVDLIHFAVGADKQNALRGSHCSGIAAWLFFGLHAEGVLRAVSESCCLAPLR